METNIVGLVYGPSTFFTAVYQPFSEVTIEIKMDIPVVITRRDGIQLSDLLDKILMQLLQKQPFVGLSFRNYTY